MWIIILYDLPNFWFVHYQEFGNSIHPSETCTKRFLRLSWTIHFSFKLNVMWWVVHYMCTFMWCWCTLHIHVCVGACVCIYSCLLYTMLWVHEPLNNTLHSYWVWNNFFSHQTLSFLPNTTLIFTHCGDSCAFTDQYRVIGGRAFHENKKAVYKLQHTCQQQPYEELQRKKVRNGLSTTTTWTRPIDDMRNPINLLGYKNRNISFV